MIYELPQRILDGTLVTAKHLHFIIPLTGLLLAGQITDPATAQSLEQGWTNPPTSARLRAYWWWLNGNVTPAAITRDLEEMKAKGWGGALICDAGGAEQDGNDPVKHGPTFFTPEWRALYKHALREADRLGLEMSLNIMSGWNLGGPMVTAEDAAKKLVWSEARTTGPARFEQKLPEPKSRDGYYRDTFVVGYRLRDGVWPGVGGSRHRPLQNWEEKALHKTLHFSAPDSTPLLQELPTELGEEDAHLADVLDLTAKVAPDGTLRWDVPEGAWQILRFGCTIGDHSRVSTCSDGWKGFALDVLDAGAFQRYWDTVVEPLIADAGPLAGKTLKYLHTDSWEVEAVNWTPSLREEFRARRGYDLVPFLPVLAGRIVESRTVSDRFLHDFRKTIGDLAIDNHYRLFKEGAHRDGLQIHPESGGPHAVPIDAQRCLGYNDAPMSEFWAWSWKHRVGDSNRFFVKQPASAAHTYGHPLVLAEGFTTIGPHWQETIWDNLKPSFNHALCEGLNLLVWHAFVCSPEEEGLPGIQYFAGTHFNPNSTWWPKSGPFIAYLNRCQWMLQQGLFVADACYYYGDHVPNFAQLKRSDPAHVLPGYDYDVVTEENVLTRLSVKDGRLTLPDGMSYRLLVLRDSALISLPVLRKLKELAAAGATILGSKPVMATGLEGFPQSDAEVSQLASGLWDKGLVKSNLSARAVLAAAGVPPDFTFTGADAQTALNYIHRRDGAAEIYFVANSSNRWEDVRCTFRVTDKAPELWDPVSGEHRLAAAYAQTDGRTTLPLTLAPFGAMFVVFREPAAAHPATAPANSSKFQPILDLAGPWTAHFPAGASAPERSWAEEVKSSTRSVVFNPLKSWTTQSDPGIKFYSGAATYTKTFDLPVEALQRKAAGHGIALDLGRVRELAAVRLNGQSLGIVWTPPFRVDITAAVKPVGNVLDIEVVSFWPNRIIGDASLPAEKRHTRTNIRKLTADTSLMESGLLGPVRIETADQMPYPTDK